MNNVIFVSIVLSSLHFFVFAPNVPISFFLFVASITVHLFMVAVTAPWFCYCVSLSVHLFVYLIGYRVCGHAIVSFSFNCFCFFVLLVLEHFLLNIFTSTQKSQSYSENDFKVICSTGFYCCIVCFIRNLIQLQIVCLVEWIAIYYTRPFSHSNKAEILQ